MNLIAQSEADNSFLIEDAVNGFGKAMTFKGPGGTPVVPVNGQHIRVGNKIDPATGAIIAGDVASVTARISSLVGNVPIDGWTVDVADSTGTVNQYKIETAKTMWDRTLGRVTFPSLKKVGA